MCQVQSVDFSSAGVAFNKKERERRRTGKQVSGEFLFPCKVPHAGFVGEIERFETSAVVLIHTVTHTQNLLKAVFMACSKLLFLLQE